MLGTRCSGAGRRLCPQQYENMKQLHNRRQPGVWRSNFWTIELCRTLRVFYPFRETEYIYWRRCKCVEANMYVENGRAVRRNSLKLFNENWFLLLFTMGSLSRLCVFVCVFELLMLFFSSSLYTTDTVYWRAFTANNSNHHNNNYLWIYNVLSDRWFDAGVIGCDSFVQCVLFSPMFLWATETM